jgi:hypothetical protein
MANTERLSNASSDHFWMAGSRWFVAPSDATYDIIRVPKNCFVMRVYLFISVAYVGTTQSLTIGWSGNGETAVTNGFITNDIAKSTEKGLKRSESDTKTTFRGKYFNSGSGTITMTIAAGNASTLGTFRVFAEYSQIF